MVKRTMTDHNIRRKYTIFITSELRETRFILVIISSSSDLSKVLFTILRKFAPPGTTGEISLPLLATASERHGGADAGGPEIGIGQVRAQRLADAGFAGGGSGHFEEGFILGQEGRTFALPLGIQRLTQQMAEDIREVIKRNSRKLP